MKCFKGWTIGLAATALLAAPGAILAQQTPSATPPSSSRPASAEGQPAAALEHLTKAKTALDDIPATSVTGETKTRVAELKQRITSLEQTASKQAVRGAANWSRDVAAIDKTLTELLDAQSAAGAAVPTGTAGSATPGARGKSDAAIDETTRAKLQEVRTHIAAFAAAMSSGGATPSEPASSPAATPPADSATAAAAPQAQAPSTPTATPQPEPAQPTPPAATAPATPQSDPAAPRPEAAQQPVDSETVKRHLTAARDSLSQLTQLPAATQLTGDARMQISQLITNFNELITTNNEWRAAYAKVAANLNTLVGDQRTDEPQAPAAPGATPGAVGTSGTIALDPTIKAKLVEFRKHLLEFEKAAGGAPASTPSEPANQPQPAPASSSAAASSPTTPTTPSEPTAAAPPPAPASPAATGSTGRTAEEPRPAGTSGTTPAPEQARPGSSPDQSSQGAASKQAGHADAMRHIEAIEAILNGRTSDAKPDSPAGTSGRATSPTSLDREQIEQVKQHLTELRRALSQSGGH
jgi:hypothetical protein